MFAPRASRQFGGLAGDHRPDDLHADGNPDEHGHGHSHGLVDRSIVRSRAGIRAVSVSLVVLTATAVVQSVIYARTWSVALLADLIHNFGDAATAIPLGLAFFFRSVRGERFGGLAVVFAIGEGTSRNGWQPTADGLLTMRSERQPVAASGNSLVLVQAIFRPSASRTFATGCALSVPELFHPNRPKNARFGSGNDRTWAANPHQLAHAPAG